MQRFKLQMHHTELKVHFDFFQSEFLHTEPLAEFQQDPGSSDNFFFHQLMKNLSPHDPQYKRLKNRRGIIIIRTCHVTPKQNQSLKMAKTSQTEFFLDILITIQDMYLL